MRIIKGADYELRSPPFVQDDGETPNSSLSVVCAITREDGTVLDQLEATPVQNEPGVYSVTLTAAAYTDRCDVLTASWTEEEEV